MKSNLLFILLLVVLAAITIEADEDFQSWFKQHRAGRVELQSYDLKEKELIWKEHDARIKEHNKKYDKGLSSYKQAHNQFSDMTFANFKTKFANFGLIPDRSKKGKLYKRSGKKAPASVDWVKAGYVNNAKSQGSCGSCYSFAATAALEGQVKRYFNQLPKLSNQQVTSCGGRGCDGGNANGVYTYLNTSGGIVSENDYQYFSGDSNNAGNCQTPNPVDSRLVVAKVLDTSVVCDALNSRPYSEDLLVDAIANVGPIYVSIFASGPGFQTYSSGVYTCDSSCSSSSTNHAVVAVGYGTDSATGKSYFTIMNSWGAAWGDRGVAWIERNNNFMIGIGKQAWYPLIDQSYRPPPIITPPKPVLNNVDSLILNSKLLEDNMLLKMVGAAKLKLLYRGSRDGFLSKDFHKYCDGKSGTIALVKPKGTNYVFGGYASKPWDSTGEWITDSEAFIFSLRRNGISSVDKYAIRESRTVMALMGNLGSYPMFQFGNNLRIRNDAENSNFNSMGQNCVAYACPTESLGSDADVVLTGKNGGFKVQELEVFQVAYALND